MPAASITQNGKIKKPDQAAIAPVGPRIREPNTAVRLTTLGPGRNWQSAYTSLNSSAVIQRFRSTNIRRVHINVPPKPISVILKKARKSSTWLGIGGEVASGVAGSGMTEISSLRPPLRPIDLSHHGQFNHHE